MVNFFYIFAGVGLLGLAVVLFLITRVRALAVDNDKAARIARAIRSGAFTFLREEYKIIALVALLVGGIIWWFVGHIPALVFASGALLSMITGFIGMFAATDANVRTAIAAKEGGEHEAFLVAFFGGGVMGFDVASFGLLGLASVFFFFSGNLICFLEIRANSTVTFL